MSATVRDTQNVEHMIALMLAANERHNALRTNEHTHVLADNTIVRCIETHDVDQHVREEHVSYVHANAVQAAKRHRARHRDAAKRHTEQSQYARARFEAHDVEASTFASATTQRALRDETVRSSRDERLSHEISVYDASRIDETDAQRQARVSDAAQRRASYVLARKRRAARDSQSAHVRAVLERESRV